jgi:hypothetical protein
MTAALAVLALAVLATGWHAVTEHKVHRRAWRLVRPSTAVPETGHHAWWHSLPRRYRLAIQGALLLCGLAFGTAYPLAPVPVLVTGAVAVAAGVTAGVRAMVRERRAERVAERP